MVTGDKDLMQIVSDRIRLLDTMKDKVTGLEEVRQRFGGPPDKVMEVQALAGDSSDNIPGVPGIGEKTARELIGEFGSLENLLANIDEVRGETPGEPAEVRRAGPAVQEAGQPGATTSPWTSITTISSSRNRTERPYRPLQGDGISQAAAGILRR